MDKTKVKDHDKDPASCKKKTKRFSFAIGSMNWCFHDVSMRGAMDMAISSWNSSLQA